MVKPLYQQLEKDIRFIEGLKSCMNCGICTAICPAASVSDYDPRNIMDIVQQENEKSLKELLIGDKIWMCGECLSCKTRCPRGNTPGYIIQSLRALSIETGLFIESQLGRQQLAVKRTVGDHILKYGYCVYIDEVNTEMYPEQGPVWDWLKQNKESILQKLNAKYNEEKAGTLHKIPQSSLNDLQRIFEATGAISRFEKIEKYSAQKAKEMKLEIGQNTNSEYFNYVYNKKYQDE